MRTVHEVLASDCTLKLIMPIKWNTSWCKWQSCLTAVTVAAILQKKCDELTIISSRLLMQICNRLLQGWLVGLGAKLLPTSKESAEHFYDEYGNESHLCHFQLVCSVWAHAGMPEAHGDEVGQDEDNRGNLKRLALNCTGHLCFSLRVCFDRCLLACTAILAPMQLHWTGLWKTWVTSYLCCLLHRLESQEHHVAAVDL